MQYDQLPEIHTGFGAVETIRDGKKVLVPKAPDMRVLWREENEPFGYVDAEGTEWEVGWLDGRQVKRRTR